MAGQGNAMWEHMASALKKERADINMQNGSPEIESAKTDIPITVERLWDPVNDVHSGRDVVELREYR